MANPKAPVPNTDTAKATAMARNTEVTAKEKEVMANAGMAVTATANMATAAEVMVATADTGKIRSVTC